MSLTLPPVDREALVATRRDLHEHPELGFQETRTSTLVADRLKGLGYQVKTGVGRTGVVALKAGSGTSTVNGADGTSNIVDARRLANTTV